VAWRDQDQSIELLSYDTKTRAVRREGEGSALASSAAATQLRRLALQCSGGLLVPRRKGGGRLLSIPGSGVTFFKLLHEAQH
jgi:hypothetical protein